ncbi:tetratricopeptide repeat protein [Granulicella sibirica]|uniref:tetratricopeptide repeat protein n=1 Tax=Granulicella sibirica TaxID=2479048 RepID=UPI001008BF49|nr:hypothetical protein [Granulicella sibirica]
MIQADLDVQAGDYSYAREHIVRALEQDVTWDALARLAYLEGLLGDVDEADRLYLLAQDELTAKEMHAYAWVEVQRGVLDFQRGRYTAAESHYRRASKAYSGYWLVEERIAEVDGARGAFDEAAGAYARLHESQTRPEWAHAMGDLYSLRADLSSAHGWKLMAHAGYRVSIEDGGVHYLHALVDLCCEMPGQAEEAVRWAGMDEALRSNYQTRGNLAWSLYRSGCLPEAEQWIEKALDSPAVCGRLYLQAACIFAAAGRVDASQRYFQLARTFNAVPAKAFLTERSSKMKIRVFPESTGGVSPLQRSLRVLPSC